jgi:putative membrane protein
MPVSGPRWPARVYGVGREPDPRFTLANERTALAWMRTALAVVAGGIALISLAVLPGLPGWIALLGAGACLGGAALSVRAVVGWARAERAMRLGEPLPVPRALPLLAVGIVVLAAATIAFALAQGLPT